MKFMITKFFIANVHSYIYDNIIEYSKIHLSDSLCMFSLLLFLLLYSVDFSWFPTSKSL